MLWRYDVVGVAVSDPVTSPLSHHSSVFCCLATILHLSLLPSLLACYACFPEQGIPVQIMAYGITMILHKIKPFLVLLQPAKHTPSTACTATCSQCLSLWDLFPIPPMTRPQVGSPCSQQLLVPAAGLGRTVCGVCRNAVPSCRAAGLSTARIFGQLLTKWPRVAPRRSQGLSPQGSSRVDSLQDKINKRWKNQLKTKLSKDPRKWLAYF